MSHEPPTFVTSDTALSDGLHDRGVRVTRRCPACDRACWAIERISLGVNGGSLPVISVCCTACGYLALHLEKAVLGEREGG